MAPFVPIHTIFPKNFLNLKNLILSKLWAAPLQGFAIKAIRWIAARYIAQSTNNEDLKGAVLFAWGLLNIADRHIKAGSAANAVVHELDIFFRDAHAYLGDPATPELDS